MSEYEGKYLGSSKIAVAKLVEEKTPLGAAIVDVETEDKKRRLVPEEMLKRIATEKPVDASEFRDMRVKPVCEKIMDILAECDIAISDWEYVSQIIKGSINMSWEKAEEIMWNTSEKTFLDLDRVLRKKDIGFREILGE